MIDYPAYFKALKEHKPEEITEHTLRPDLKILLMAFAEEADSKLKVLHEPKRVADYGAPDFKITLHEGILGYVENKALGTDLNQTLKTDQIARYKKLSDNILLTNYLDWFWIKDGKKISRASLCSLDELHSHKFTQEPDKLEEVSKLIRNFFSSPAEGIGKPKALAQALGQRGKLLKSYLLDELIRQQETENEGKLFGLYNTFKKMVDHELQLEDFADTFAQMLVYGLFMARLNSQASKISLNNVEQFIPSSFELIQELVGFLRELNKPNYSETRWIVEEVLAILNTMNMSEIIESLSFDKHNKSADAEIAKDPYIYFYEDFLAAYDKALKKAKGVYYTPPPVVNFIIRAVNDVLKDTFGIADGLADYKKVTLLDFACGTGTFLLESIRQILNATPESKRDLIIKGHILKNLYGFEYMMAPYTVAHLKLTQYLKDRGYELEPEERFNIFLTNTLEHFELEDEQLLPALSDESRKAKGVKDKPILVITGNPPYSYASKNNGEWIKGLVKDYYFCDGKPLGEKNPKALQDDYVKFIRFAQWKIDKEEEGIVAIITNHSFLDSPTLRGMRESLLNTFDDIYSLDLHGNTTAQEIMPDGCRDENVFDIMQGVSISIFVKRKGKRKTVFYDLYGTRSGKNGFLYKSSLKDISWQDSSPSSSMYLLNNKGSKYKEVYENYTGLQDIFSDSISCVNTGADKLFVDFSSIDLAYSLQQSVNVTDFNNTLIKAYDYRPFDTRFVYYDTKLLDRARANIMSWFSAQVNFGLLLMKSPIPRELSQVFVTSNIADANFYGYRTHVFPLFKGTDTMILGGVPLNRVNNINKNFMSNFRNLYQDKLPYDDIPEKLFGYIYAVLHSITYREKYKDSLKTDFPRIPFCDDFATFEKMSALGWDMINAHLMKSDDLKREYPDLGAYSVKGSNEITKVFYMDDQERVYINDTQYFSAIPEPIWEFHIGGYQVLNKYLKDRKNRILTLDEINNVEFIVKILAFTRDAMQEIDLVAKDWI